MAEKKPKEETQKPVVPPVQPALPKQIRDQIAAAEVLRTDMNSQPESPQQAEEPPVDPAQTSPAIAASSPPEEGETLEQRYRSQAGRLEQALRLNQQMHDKLNHLEQQIAGMQARGAEPPPAAEAPAPRAKPKLVTDEEVQDFGEDLLTVVGKRAREEYAPEFDELAERLKRLEGRVEGAATVIQRTQQQELYGTLGEHVPEWRDINKSEDFKLWLQQPDPFSGRRRHDLLLDAYGRHEAGRVVAFFRGFLTEAAGLPQAPQARTPSAPPLPGNGQASGKPSLEDFAAPGRARSAPQELPPDKPTYTNAWIAKFMADKRTGKYRGREADADAIERDIYQAQHEGRIQ